MAIKIKRLVVFLLNGQKFLIREGGSRDKGVDPMRVRVGSGGRYKGNAGRFLCREAASKGRRVVGVPFEKRNIDQNDVVNFNAKL